MKKDYSKLEKITVKSQAELDDIPEDFEGNIYIEFGVYWDRAVVRKRYKGSVVAWENSSVDARGNSSVDARENSSVVAWENSSVDARENSSVDARGNSSVVAWENSSVDAWENSSVDARGNSSVVAWENSSVVAWENSSVVAWENSSVVAWENSSVDARGNSSIDARENSSVDARGNSSVDARENSSVVAWENSSVDGNGNAQITDRQINGRIKLSGNARTVYDPKNIEEYCSYYGIKHGKKNGKFYKAVHKRDDMYISDNDSDFQYFIGKKAKADSLDTDVTENCGHGIHISHKAWAVDYGKGWNDLAILEVEAELSGIVVPTNGRGKVRCAEVKVLREVPLEECGLYGKMLAQRNERRVTA